MFFKLKASGPPQQRAGEGDKLSRQRRRLSKPLTNKSSANLLILSAQQLEGQMNNSSGVDLSPASLSTTTPLENFLEAEQHSRIWDPNLDILQDHSLGVKEEGLKGTAFIPGERQVRNIDSLALH